VQLGLPSKIRNDDVAEIGELDYSSPIRGLIARREKLFSHVLAKQRCEERLYRALVKLIRLEPSEEYTHGALVFVEGADGHSSVTSIRLI
jgi:hypothetical protein